MRVVGIDPAPAKGLAVFDGTYREVSIAEARAFIDGLAKADTLVCWDAPLTGPPTAVIAGGIGHASSFTQRPIESFFSRAATGFKTPKGISVRAYSGCPHWALSRSLIGLPRTGRFDSFELPFALAQDQERRPSSGRHVVEVHPALALWLWCRGSRPADSSWEYKKDPRVRDELWECLMRVPQVAEVLASCTRPPRSDDELDARVSYALGALWLRKPSLVQLVGDADRGTFLLPRIDRLADSVRRQALG